MSALGLTSPDFVAEAQPRHPQNRGIFSFWFGQGTSLRADPSRVFQGLVFRLKQRDATFTQPELALLKQCETDVQVRAVTAGYVTGAGTHSALGFVAKKAPRMLLACLAGVAGAYVGVQSMGRDCMRRVARLPDSKLAQDTRAVIRMVNPDDPLAREPTGVVGDVNKNVVSWKHDVGDTARVRGGGLRDDRSDANFLRDSSIQQSESGNNGFGGFATPRGRAISAAASSAQRLLGDDEVLKKETEYALPQSARAASERSNDHNDTFTSRFAVRDAWGGDGQGGSSGIETKYALMDGRKKKRLSRTHKARELRYAAAGASKARKLEEGKLKAAREGYGDSPPLDATSRRDELRDPSSARVGRNRGTRRTSYGDVIDR